MTKVQVRLDLVRPLDENSGSVERAHSVYGIFHVQADPAANAIDVEYDATRLSIGMLRAELIKAGVPVTPTIR